MKKDTKAMWIIFTILFVGLFVILIGLAFRIDNLKKEDGELWSFIRNANSRTKNTILELHYEGYPGIDASGDDICKYIHNHPNNHPYDSDWTFHCKEEERRLNNIGKNPYCE